MASSTCITRDPMSGDYSSKGTWSFWIKISDPDLSNNGGIFMIRKGNSYTASRLRIYLESGSNKLVWELKDSGGADDSFIKTNARLRDVGSWYHICMSYDSTLGTAADRLKMWINGKDVRTEYGGFQSDDQVGSGFQYLASSAMFVGLGRVDENNGLDYKFDGSMAECYFIYDSTYDVSTFGETDATTGEWKPKLDIASGITFGSQGFYFPFTNAADMKADSSGNSNTYSITGTLTQSQDCPSNVFNTWNPLDDYYEEGTFYNGNTTYQAGTANGKYSRNTSTLGMTSGKFYWEVKPVSVNTGIDYYPVIGITASQITGTQDYVGKAATDYSWGTNQDGSSTQKYNNNSSTAWGNHFALNSIVGVAVDLDNNKIYFSKDGVWQESGDPTSGSTGTGAAFTITSASSTPLGAYFPSLSNYDATGYVKFDANFGNGYFGTTAVTSAGINASGNGIFEYDVPTGYTALSTKGLNL